MKKEIIEAINKGECGGYLRDGNRIVHLDGPSGSKHTTEKFICKITDGKPEFNGAPRKAAIKAAAMSARQKMKAGLEANSAIAQAVNESQTFVMWGEIQDALGLKTKLTQNPKYPDNPQEVMVTMVSK